MGGMEVVEGVGGVDEWGGEWGGGEWRGDEWGGDEWGGVSNSLSLSLQCAGGRWKAPRVVAGRGWS